MTGRLAGAVDAITDCLRGRELDKARTLFDEAVNGRQDLLEALARQLAATVVRPAGMVVWGHGIDIWANPHRFDYGARCGGCRWAAVNYTTDRAAQRAAQQHVAEQHGGRLVVVSFVDTAYQQAVEAEKENDVGAKEVKAARVALAATIANEVTLNGGRPVSEDNPHVKAARQRVDDAVAEVDRANDPWNNA